MLSNSLDMFDLGNVNQSRWSSGSTASTHADVTIYMHVEMLLCVGVVCPNEYCDWY